MTNLPLFMGLKANIIEVSHEHVFKWVLVAIWKIMQEETAQLR
jgi:hypothetical protein